jgi:excinuclease ABC subunit C
VLELDCGQPFDSSRDTDFFAAIPPRAAVCLVQPHESSAEPFLFKTQNLQRRLERLLGPLDPTSKRLHLRDIAGSIRYRLTGSAFEQSLAYYQNARTLFPQRYRKLARIRPPAVLKVNLRNAYPRCFVTRRIPVDESGGPTAGVYYGPYRSRKAAEDFAGQALDFFKVRRCQIKIQRDPAFPGCMYSEMKMCLAPCFAGCTAEEYGAEVHRLVEFLDTSGDSLRNSYESDRERSSDDLDFEKAAAIHKKIEKLNDALRARPELARRIQDLDALILQRTAEEQTIAAFPVRAGYLDEPFFLRFAEIASQPRSAEQLARDRLEAPPLLNAGAEPRGTLTEHLSLLARWFYSNPRSGEILFREKDWPYRRILRACSRLLAAPGSPKAP